MHGQVALALVAGCIGACPLGLPLERVWAKLESAAGLQVGATAARVAVIGLILLVELCLVVGSWVILPSATSAVATGVTARIGYPNTNRTQSKLLDDTPATTTFSDAAIPVGGSLWDPVAGARVSLLSITDGIATVRISAEPDAGAPTAPGSLAATVVSTPRVTLSWAALATNGGSPPGGWIDRLDEMGRPATDFMPASTLYHVICAVDVLQSLGAKA